jgi:hypothetical protein
MIFSLIAACFNIFMAQTIMYFDRSILLARSLQPIDPKSAQFAQELVLKKSRVSVNDQRLCDCAANKQHLCPKNTDTDHQSKIRLSMQI